MSRLADRHARRTAHFAERADRFAARMQERDARRGGSQSANAAIRARRAARAAQATADRLANNRVFGAALITLGANWLLLELGLFPFGMIGLLALTLAVLGIGMMGTARAGSAKGLVLAGIAMIFALVMASGVSSPVKGPFVGSQRYDQLRESYSLGVGELIIDLSDVELDPGITPVEADVTVGELRVIVPPGAAVDIAAKVGAGGEISLFDKEASGGIGVEDQYRSPGFDTAETKLVLDLDIAAFGEIVVERAR